MSPQSKTDTDYHDRLEQEVTALKRENILIETQKTQLSYDIKRAHAEIAGLRIELERLRKLIP